MSTLARIADLRAAYAAGLSAHTVVDAVLERIAGRGDAAVWISRFSPEVLHARCDALEAARDRAPLWGVPFAVKDNIDVAGLPTTAACPAFSYDPTTDATAVRLLLDAGAIAVGKTNLDQFATGLTGTRSPYGAPESVFGGDLISGGSSSGSAVAVAAGVVPFALGTDTAGSGRVPAAMNGIVGLKPTRGLVSTAGVVPACRSLDCVSVFAPDVAGARDVLAVLARPTLVQEGHRQGRYGPEGGFAESPTARVAVAAAGLDLDPGFAAAWARFAGLGPAVDIAPLIEAGALLYGPWVAERLADLEPFLDAHPDGVLPVTRAVLERGRDVTGAAVFRAQHRLARLRAETDRIWDTADALLVPTVPTTFTRTQIADDPIGHNLALGRFSQCANLLDLAALAVPAGTTADGRPFGVTLYGPARSEDRLMSVAHQLFEEAPCHR